VLPTWFLTAAIALRLAAGARYLVAVVRGRARPNPVTWFCWGLAPLVAFTAQLSHGLRPTEWMSLVLALGPIAIVTAAVLKNGVRGRVSRADLSCGGMALAGLVAWQLTDRPAVALLCSIGADLIAAVPTFGNAYRRPFDECAPPYLMSALAMAITLLTVNHWGFNQVALPLYILLVNLALYLVIRVRSTVDGSVAAAVRTTLRT
jgi:hypothetical protein